MSYSRPIIIELFAELFFEPGSFQFAQFFDVVPSLHDLGFTEVESAEVAQFEADTATQQIRPAVRQPRVTCWSSDRTRLVQLIPDNIVMNLVSPDATYPGWNTFLTTVVHPAIESVKRLKSRPRVASVALNAVDRFTFRLSDGPLGEYLNCGGPRIPAILADTVQPFDYDIGRGLLPVNARNRQIHINGWPDATEYTVNIHTVFHEKLGDDEYPEAKLEKLHDDANATFETLITDRLRNEIMKGRVHAARV